MAEVIYDLGDLGPFLDVVAWNAGGQGWSFEVKTPWLEGYDLAFNADSSISAGSSPYRTWPYGRFVWSDRLRFGGGGDAAHLVLADRTLYALPLRNLIFYDLLNYDFSGRRVPISGLDITISETFNDGVHTSVQNILCMQVEDMKGDRFQWRVKTGTITITHAFHGEFYFAPENESRSSVFPRLFRPGGFGVPWALRYDQITGVLPGYQSLPPLDYPVINGQTIYEVRFPAVVCAAVAGGAYIDIDFTRTWTDGGTYTVPPGTLPIARPYYMERT